MAELRSTTAIGGNIVWHGGNLRFDPQGDTILYQGYKIYTEHDTPLPGELGNGGTTSAFTKTEADARFAPIAGGGYVQKIGDTMTGKLTNTANEIEIRGSSPRLLLQDNDGTKRWYLINDGGNFSVRENDTATTRFRIDATAANFMIENIDINSKTAFRGFDSWLRINDQLTFTQGVYFGASNIRTDGQLQVGTTTTDGLLATTAVLKYKNNNVFHDGYHPNADKWTTARTLTTTLTGDVTGSASMSIDGSANATVTVTATVANDSHTHDGRYYTETESDARFANVTGDTITGKYFFTESDSSPTVAVNDSLHGMSAFPIGGNGITEPAGTPLILHSGTGGSLAYSPDGGITYPFWVNFGGGAYFAADVTAQNFVGDLVGNASTASSAAKWTTARTLTIGATGKTVDGTGNVTWTAKEITGDIYGAMYKYRRDHSVNINAPAKLLDQDGSAITRGSIRVRGVVTGTGTTDTASSATFTNINGAWSVINTTQSGSSSNRIRFFIDADGDPAVSTWHTSNYVVEVYHEFVDTGGNYHPNFWGIDGVLSAVNGTLKYGSNTVFHDAYHPNADRLTTGRLINGTSFNGTADITTAKWGTARTLTLSGDASGSVSWDGSANATLSVAVADNSHNHNNLRPKSQNWNTQTDDFVTGSSSSVAGAPTTSFINWIQWGHNGGSKYRHSLYSFADGSAMTQLWYGYKNNTSDTTSNAVGQRVFMDNYHPNADTWTTARTLSLSGDATGSVSINGSSNVTLAVTVANDSHTHDGRYYTESESNSRFAHA